MWTSRAEKDWTLQELAKTDALGVQLAPVIATALETHTNEWQAFQARCKQMDAVQFNVREVLGDPATAEARFQAEIKENLWKEFAALSAIRALLRDQHILSPNTDAYTSDKVGLWIVTARISRIFDGLSLEDQSEARKGLFNFSLRSNQATTPLSDIAANTKGHQLGTEGSKAQAILLATIAAERAQLEAESKLHKLAMKDHTVLGLVHASLNVRKAVAELYLPRK